LRVLHPDAEVEPILDALAPLGDVSARRMFGAWGIYVDAVMMAILARGRLWFKVDEVNRGAFAEAGSEPFRPWQDRRTVLSYWAVPAEVMEDRARLLSWAREALRAALETTTARRTGPLLPRR
jgi:DNA transformation protein